MLLAGTESTACAIRAAVVHIITSPIVYQRLKKEIKLGIQEGRVSRPILMEEAIKLPYLQVCF
jgi:cytochrome P450